MSAARWGWIGDNPALGLFAVVGGLLVLVLVAIVTGAGEELAIAAVLGIGYWLGRTAR